MDTACSHMMKTKENSMDIKSLLEQKNNVYDHIFYEFSMYYSSFSALLSVAICDETKLPDKQFWMNVLLESHATHLRIQKQYKGLSELFIERRNQTIEVTNTIVTTF